MLNSHPLVSVVTPVYNCETYLDECIQSVLSQTYKNWEYIIVNNCSNDNSLKIAQKYAQHDSRIKIFENTEFLPMIDNFNHTLRKTSLKSKYCKIIHADDLLFPECIEKMVEIAESDASVGVVGSYRRKGTRVDCGGLNFPQTVFPGREISRRSLNIMYAVGRIFVFGSPSSLLIRSDLIRNRDPFYNDKYSICADQEVCYHLLQHCNFGFVHQVLTYSRVHDQQVTTAINMNDQGLSEELMLIQEYGPIYFEKEAYKERMEKALDQYYKLISQNSILKFKDKEFWKFHKDGLNKLNLKLNQTRLFAGAIERLINKLVYYLLRPKKALQKLLQKTKIASFLF